MSIKSFALAAAAAVSLAIPAYAGEITVQDPYARASSMMSKSGAAFMILKNGGAEDDRLIAVASDVAERVELHTHIQNAEGVMRMVRVEDGFPVPAGGMHALQRGGDHVMFLGLQRPLAQGDVIELTLTFEKAGDVTVEVPVDLERKPMHGMMNHGQTNMQGGNMGAGN